MNVPNFLLICLIVAPLFAHIRRWKPQALFAIAALIYGGLGIAPNIETQIVLSDPRGLAAHDADTYYTVTTAGLSLVFALIMTTCALVTWFQVKFGAMRFPRITNLLFWLLHISLICSNWPHLISLLNLSKPTRYIEYSVAFETVNQISTLGMLVALLSLLSLLLLLVWSVASSWKEGRIS